MRKTHPVLMPRGATMRAMVRRMREDIAQDRYAYIWGAGKARHTALQPFESAIAFSNGLATMPLLTRQEAVRACVAEHQRVRTPFWASLICIAFEQSLCHLSFCGDSERAQSLLAGLMEVITSMRLETQSLVIRLHHRMNGAARELVKLGLSPLEQLPGEPFMVEQEIDPISETFPTDMMLEQKTRVEWLRSTMERTLTPEQKAAVLSPTFEGPTFSRERKCRSRGVALLREAARREELADRRLYGRRFPSGKMNASP